MRWSKTRAIITTGGVIYYDKIALDDDTDKISNDVIESGTASATTISATTTLATTTTATIIVAVV